jgi:hypothetical protein
MYAAIYAVPGEQSIAWIVAESPDQLAQSIAAVGRAGDGVPFDP